MASADHRSSLAPRPDARYIVEIFAQQFLENVRPPNKNHTAADYGRHKTLNACDHFVSNNFLIAKASLPLNRTIYSPLIPCRAESSMIHDATI